MKNYLLILLMLVPSILIAQESRREATPEEIKILLPSEEAIDNLSDQYLTQRLMKRLHDPLSEIQVKDLEKHVFDLEQKESEGKLSKAELELARVALDKKIALAHKTPKDDDARDHFRKALLTKKMKVLVPTAFSVDPQCASPAVVTDKKINQLNTQVKTIVKPTVHKIWFVSPTDKVEINVWYDEKNGLSLNQAD